MTQEEEPRWTIIYREFSSTKIKTITFDTEVMFWLLEPDGKLALVHQLHENVADVVLDQILVSLKR